MQLYKHEPFTDFSQVANSEAYQQGLGRVKKYLGQNYDLVIGGEKSLQKIKLFLLVQLKKKK